MLIKLIFPGIVIGVIASVMVLISGQSGWLALAAYLVVGSLGTALAGMMVLLQALRQERDPRQPGSARPAQVPLRS